jgi:hypothetical protein
MGDAGNGERRYEKRKMQMPAHVFSSVKSPSRL